MRQANQYAAAAIVALALGASGCESEQDRARNEAAVALMSAEAAIKEVAPEEFASWEAAMAKRFAVFEAAAAESVVRLKAGKSGSFSEVLEATPGRNAAEEELEAATEQLEAVAPEEFAAFMIAYRNAFRLFNEIPPDR